MATWIKRYLVFAGTVVQPNGGWEDNLGSFDEVDQARFAVSRRWRSLNRSAVKWYQILDTQEDGRIENGFSGENDEIRLVERSGRPFE